MTVVPSDVEMIPDRNLYSSVLCRGGFTDISERFATKGAC